MNSKRTIKPGEVVADTKQFDIHIKKIVPRYDELHEAVLRSIPPDLSHKIKILELGCGTGELTRKVLDRFPQAYVVAVDYSARMLSEAQRKLKRYGNRLDLKRGDFAKVKFPEDLDVVISTLAIHHLTDPQKLELFKKIFQHLRCESWFANGDVTLFESNRHALLPLQIREEEAVSQGYKLNVLDEETASGSGDFPSPLKTQLNLLEIAGFQKIDVIWKYYQFAVYGGFKHCEPKEEVEYDVSMPDF
jgi:trans-aconitate methyltransferase